MMWLLSPLLALIAVVGMGCASNPDVGYIISPVALGGIMPRDVVPFPNIQVCNTVSSTLLCSDLA